MTKAVTLEQVLELAKKLSLKDRIHLIEQVLPEIRLSLTDADNRSRQSLRGIWRGVDLTEEDITEIRQEMWAKFPREDI
jgi:hypothetical protein